MKLYGYYRSSAAYRVRIALNIKGLDYEQVAVNLLEGEDRSGQYREINPQGLVPVLEVEGHRLTQSMAILEYLEETHPEPALLPEDPFLRAEARSLANLIACDIHPLDNLRVLKYLQKELEVDNDDRDRWYRHWIEEGFRALEKRLDALGSRDFCLSDQPCLADVLLVPQVYNARRFKVDMHHYPRIEQIEQHCLQLAPFKRAIPENQPDAPHSV